MSISAFTGPVLSWADPSNPETAPSPFIEGVALLDPRPFFTYNPGQNFGALTAGFLGTTSINTLLITPAIASTTAIAAAQHTTSGTPLTLVASTGNGVSVGASTVNPNTGIAVSGLLAIGGASGRVAFGSAGTVQLWDPTTLTARAVIITASNALGTGGNFTVAGYDIYGFPMTETLTSAPGSALTVTGKKAWKYIASITPNFTDATYNYSVGTTDLYGLPLASTFAGDLIVNYNATLDTDVTTYLAGVNTAATATTGDVRGTIGLSAPSDGTKTLIVYQQPLLSNIALANGVAGTSTGLFGVNQF